MALIDPKLLPPELLRRLLESPATTAQMFKTRPDFFNNTSRIYYCRTCDKLVELIEPPQLRRIPLTVPAMWRPDVFKWK